MTAHRVLAPVAGRPGLVGGALRPATPADAAAIHALITKYQEAGRLLPRTVDEIARHADRFLVISDGGAKSADVLGCAELAPLSATAAETLADEARLAGFRSICAFTHDASLFVRLGYSLVPHAWLPEKIALDCAGCALFRACGQHAVRLELADGWGSRA